MKKILKLESDFYDGYITGERVYDENEQMFSVYDLTECPEDATIYRNLFNSSDYLRAIRYGIRLAKQGYDEVEYVEV